MSDIVLREDLVRRLSAAIRAGELYASTHPLVQRSIDTLLGSLTKNLQTSRNAVVGFLGNDIVVNDRSVDRCVTTLRAKIEPDPRHPIHIQTIRDIGYRFEQDTAQL